MRVGNPNIVTIDEIKETAGQEFGYWLAQPRNQRNIPSRMDECGYRQIVNPDARASGGRWRFAALKDALKAGCCRIPASKALASSRYRTMAIEEWPGVLE
jgi:hypothetical protein